MVDSSPSNPIRVALIGHGLAGAYFHGPLLEADRNFKITWVATSRTDTLKLRRDAPRWTADPAAACTAGEVDLVVIATPNHTHRPLARLALEAGKHVVLDKPFVLSVASADELIALAHARSRMLSVFHNRRFDGDFLAVRQALLDQEIGDLLLFESRWDRFRNKTSGGWRDGPAAGAGLLWDLGPHLVDQALQLFGSPDRWSADIGAQRSASGADDYFELTLWYGRMRCLLSASTSVAAVRPRFAAHGTRGSLVTYGVDPYEAALRSGEKPDDPAFRDHLPHTRGLLVDSEGGRQERTIEAGRWETFYPEISHAILNGGTVSSAAGLARATIAMIESAHQAHTSGPT